jgi:hypothetical protein
VALLGGMNDSPEEFRSADEKVKAKGSRSKELGFKIMNGRLETSNCHL